MLYIYSSVMIQPMNIITQSTEYLIIGQGIAGTLFAHELEKHGHDFMVIDPNLHNASKTAAGMYNPVVLKRFSPVWQGQQQIELAKKTIAELSGKLDGILDYPMDIFRIFHDEAEKSTWTKKTHHEDLSKLLDTQFYNNENSAIHAPLGLGRIALGGKIDLKTLLKSYRQHLEKQQKMLTENVDYQKLNYANNQFTYHGMSASISAKKVVCCEGYGIKQNPYFNELPLKGNKGEVLIVKAPNLNLSAAIKSKVFIMPMTELGDDIYFVGATYNWTDKDDIPSQAAQDELLEKLSQFVDSDVEVISQHAGIRPTVIDRRPLLGQHATQPSLYILNGLGTRGVMLGASMAKYLYDFIEVNAKLPKAVDITRFQ